MKNGCITDEDNAPPYVKVGEVDFHKTGVKLTEYRSLRGTSKVEALHSVMARSFYTTNGLAREVYNGRLSWTISRYNRNRLL